MTGLGHDNQGFSLGEDGGKTNRNPKRKASADSEKDSRFSNWPCPLRQIVTYISNVLADTKLGVHILVCVFAISAWADLNGMWSELPVLVLEAPESWNLPSYIIIISQVANIGPLIFIVATILASNTKSQLEKYTSFFIIVSDIVAVILLSFFWNHTSFVAGMERSTALLVLNFFFALGDCTSSVAFYAFMSSMKPQYMASLFLGEGLSGMLPAFIALGQGVSDINCIQGSNLVNSTYQNGTRYNKTEYFTYPQFGKPGFSVQVYFLIISGILVFSAVAFVLLNTLSYCKSEMVGVRSYDLEKLEPSARDESKVIDESKLGPFSNIDKTTDTKKTSNIKGWFTFPEISSWKFATHLVFTVVINMTLTTFLASIQSYSTLPYGLDPYHLATNLAQITNPVACFFAVFVMTSNIGIIGAIFLLGEVGVGMIIYIAATSPAPHLHDEQSGDVMTVGLWVAVTFLLVYAKVCVAGVLRQSGRRALIWLGAATQIGSLIGAITGFLLVNHYEVFISAPYC